MTETTKFDSGPWLKKRDQWMRELISSAHVSRNGKLAGVYVALRMSAKKPYTYPAMKTMAVDLRISLRQVARALKELEDEHYLRVKRNPGFSSSYSLGV